jgi:hypothetical protein
MSYLHKVNRVTLFGTAYGGLEEWTTGFFLGSETGDATAPIEAGAQAIRDAWLTFWNTGNNNISEQWRFSGVKIATINQDGSTDKDSVVYSHVAIPDPGPKVGVGLPPQISLVASLLAAPGTGVARKGRMYLPGVAENISTNGKLTSTTPLSLANTLATFFNSVNADFNVGDRVILASKGPKPQPSFGLNRPVETLRVGDVYDTQRRRRNQLVEAYVQATVNP